VEVQQAFHLVGPAAKLKLKSRQIMLPIGFFRRVKSECQTDDKMLSMSNVVIALLPCNARELEKNSQKSFKMFFVYLC
jgi:hypothetical protein